MKERSYLAKWRNPKAEQRYRERDAALWQRDLTQTPPQAIDVPTSFGPTRAYRWPGDGPQLIFLHGMGDTSIRWVPYAEQLKGNDIYAIDIMGDVGASDPAVGFTSAADYPEWLDQAITGLGLANPTMVGESLGGYLTLSYAMNRPVASAIAFDPVGVVKLRHVRLMAMGISGLLVSVTPAPIRKFLGRRLRQPLLLDKPALRLYSYGQRQHPPKLPPLPVFTDEQLASISAPLHVLVGAHTTVFDVEQLVLRINTIGRRAEAHLVPDAGHGFTMTHPDQCLTAIRSALRLAQGS